MRLTPTAWRRMIEHLLSCLPEEGCGLLGGREGKAEAVYPVPNSLHSPTEFLMDPKEQLRAFKQLLQDGYELLAIFHSHPYAPPVPSQRDLLRAYDTERHQPYHPGVKHLIVSLLNPCNPVAKCYGLTDDGQFVEEPIEIGE